MQLAGLPPAAKSDAVAGAPVGFLICPYNEAACSMAGKLSPVLASGIAGFERYLISAAAFSFFINLLTLSIPLYSIQVYDRVLSGGSGATLFVLSVAAVAGLLAAASLEDIRCRLLIALGLHFDAKL